MIIMKNYQYKFLLVIALLILLMSLMSCVKNAPVYNDDPNREISESVNFKLVNKDDVTNMYMKTNQSSITFYLKITPKINRKCPIMFTIFMNGKQIECFWDNNDKPAKTFFTNIEPQKQKLIKICIENIPEGLNTLQFGTLVNPKKIDFKEEDLSSRKNSLNLAPFTINRNENENWPDNSTFQNYDYLTLVNIDMPVGMDGFLTFTKDVPVLDLITNTNEHKKIYYYWENNDNKTRKVRFSLLNNWEQVPWPSGDLFIDVVANPGDVYSGELLLSDITQKGVNQLSVIAFVDPDKSFWWYDTLPNGEKELKANHYGAQAYSTLRSIVFVND